MLLKVQFVLPQFVWCVVCVCNCVCYWVLAWWYPSPCLCLTPAPTRQWWDGIVVVFAELHQPAWFLLHDKIHLGHVDEMFDTIGVAKRLSDLNLHTSGQLCDLELLGGGHRRVWWKWLKQIFLSPMYVDWVFAACLWSWLWSPPPPPPIFYSLF